MNLIGDYGGGGAYLAIGVLAALLEAERSGEGQVVDAAMVDGAASLMTIFYGLLAGGMWQDERGTNLLDGAAPFYRPYETSDGRHVFVGAIVPQFFAELLQHLGIESIELKEQHDRSKWASHIETFSQVFLSRSRDEWAMLFAGTDACVAPVLSLGEAPNHPHNQARDAFVEIDGVTQPAPAPRFQRTASATPAGNQPATVEDILAGWGCSKD